MEHDPEVRRLLGEIANNVRLLTGIVVAVFLIAVLMRACG